MSFSNVLCAIVNKDCKSAYRKTVAKKYKFKKLHSGRKLFMHTALKGGKGHECIAFPLTVYL